MSSCLLIMPPPPLQQASTSATNTAPREDLTVKPEAMTSNSKLRQMLDSSDYMQSSWGFQETSCRRCGISNSELEGSLIQCGKCKKAYYCGYSCFNADRANHMKICKKGTTSGIMLAASDHHSDAARRQAHSVGSLDVACSAVAPFKKHGSSSLSRTVHGSGIPEDTSVPEAFKAVATPLGTLRGQSLPWMLKHAEDSLHSGAVLEDDESDDGLDDEVTLLTSTTTSTTPTLDSSKGSIPATEDLENSTTLSVQEEEPSPDQETLPEAGTTGDKEASAASKTMLKLKQNRSIASGRIESKGRRRSE